MCPPGMCKMRENSCSCNFNCVNPKIAPTTPMIMDGMRTKPIFTKPKTTPMIADGGMILQPAKTCKASPQLQSKKFCKQDMTMCPPGMCKMRENSCSCNFKCQKPKEESKPTWPNGCITFNDGCNTCTKSNDSEKNIEDDLILVGGRRNPIERQKY